jgi:hypothetical protein
LQRRSIYSGYCECWFFWDFSLHSSLVLTVAWNATKTIGADNTTGIKDTRVKEGDNSF